MKRIIDAAFLQISRKLWAKLVVLGKGVAIANRKLWGSKAA